MANRRNNFFFSIKKKKLWQMDPYKISIDSFSFSCGGKKEVCDFLFFGLKTCNWADQNIKKNCVADENLIKARLLHPVFPLGIFLVGIHFVNFNLVFKRVKGNAKCFKATA